LEGREMMMMGWKEAECEDMTMGWCDKIDGDVLSIAMGL